MAPIGSHAERAADAFQRFGRKRHWCAAHSRVSGDSGSMVTSRGYSCCSASCCVALHLGFRDVAREKSRHANARLVDVHHDGERLGVRLVKHGFEHPDDEFLGRVVVVVQQHLPQPRVFDSLVGVGFSLDAVANFRLRHPPIIMPTGKSARFAGRQRPAERRACGACEASPRRSSSSCHAGARQPHQPLNLAHKAPPGHRPSSERHEMFGLELAVDQRIAPSLELRAQARHRDLRRVDPQREHRLAEEHAADRHAVDAAGQFAVHPHLDRMRQSGGVQRGVGAAHRRAEPRAGFLHARCGAAFEHARKGAIDGDPESFPLEALAQRMRDVES